MSAADLAMAPRGDRRGWLVAPAVVVLLALFVYPFIYGVVISFQPMDGGSIWANYIHFFTTSTEFNTLWATFKLAAPATLINVGMAVPVAFALRRNSRKQRIVTTILVIPITLGTVLIADGMLTFYSPVGWFSQLVHGLNLYSQEVRLTHNYWGVLISLVISDFPFVFLLTLSYISGIDPTLAKAAGTLGANTWQQFRLIYLPLLVPGLSMAAALSFVQTFAVFPSAILLGAPAGPTRVISIAAYEAAFEQYDYGMASAIAIVMGFAQLLIVCAIFAFRRAFYTGPATSGKG
ncbi:sugar ABC transporter permease [uncultured Castellaniella sp.]|jgi:putative spermidine/putrescine transport system permease protein|uniref:ABC transporter permease n=1 Tax=uncultured Castellaniella sp. TaxID=647907 RepID=UPI00262C065B|nr:sugar ABC transporter permease [uncultured Castellaniella sp.]